ncbi:MAG: hypothetical protein DDT22_01197 [candidate division WS2 bacterium]|nr:hypothetical protein [Candidatus Lithacetigena glycinireducens]
MKIVPVSLRFANDFVTAHHRHSKPVRGCKFTIAVEVDSKIVGVLIAGRPVARNLDDGMTLEVTRCCVLEGYKNVCSKLYSTARRISSLLGYRRCMTYTLLSESGSSLRAVAARIVSKTRLGGWSRSFRPRLHQEIYQQQKLCWHL